MKYDKILVATKAFLVNKEGNVLVIREAPTYSGGSHIGKYDLPGGRAEEGQGLKDNLSREVEEETGIILSETPDPFYSDVVVQEIHNQRWQKLRLFYKITAPDSAIKLSSDHDDYKWINPKNYKDEMLIENLYDAFQEFIGLTG